MEVWAPTTPRPGIRSEVIRREQLEKAKTYAKVIKEMNVVKEGEKSKRDLKGAKKEVSKREKAIEFAKQIKRPAKPAKLIHNSNSRDDRDTIDHMAYLEAQHRSYQERVKALSQN